MKKQVFDVMDACAASALDFVRVFTYDDEEYRNMFCVEVWLNE